jgi:sigma-E factor negative regulatory protein RseA
VAGAVMVVWVFMFTGGAPTSGQHPQMALVPPAPPVATAPPVTALAPLAATPQAEVSVPSEGQSNEYLLAHQGISPSTAMQGVAPYIRTVSDIGQVTPVPR